MTPPRLYDKGEHSAGVQPLCLGQGGGDRSHPKLSPRSSGSEPGPVPSSPVSEPQPAPPAWQAGGRSAQPCSVCAQLWAHRESRPRAESIIFPGAPSPLGRPSLRPGQPHPYKHRESTEAWLTLVWPRGLPGQPRAGRGLQPRPLAGWELVQTAGRRGSPVGGPRPPSWLGWAGGPSSPLRPFPEHPQRQTVSPAHLGNDSRRERGGRDGGGPSDPHPPHQTQDCGFSGRASPGLNPLSQRAPSHPPGLMDGR